MAKIRRFLPIIQMMRNMNALSFLKIQTAVVTWPQATMSVKRLMYCFKRCVIEVITPWRELILS
jgi:hypothetical protein